MLSSEEKTATGLLEVELTRIALSPDISGFLVMPFSRTFLYEPFHSELQKVRFVNLLWRNA